MTANELRLGNIVSIELHDIDTNCTISEIHNDGVCIEGDKNTFFLMSGVNGIPLTPEILQLCGFVQDRTGFSLLDKMSLSFSVTKNSKFLPCWMDRTLYPGAWRTVEYVHQLQNLYYALTGEELNINL